MNEEELQKSADEVRGRLQEIGRIIKAELPAGWRFVLLVASEGSLKGAVTLYISTIERADSLQLMREFIATQREERNWMRDVAGESELPEEFEHWWQWQNKRRSGKGQALKKWCEEAFTAGRASA